MLHWRRERRKGKQRYASSLMWSNKVRGCMEFQASVCAGWCAGQGRAVSTRQLPSSPGRIKAGRISRQQSPSLEICPVPCSDRAGSRVGGSIRGCHKVVNISLKEVLSPHLSMPLAGFLSTTDAMGCDALFLQYFVHIAVAS